MSMRCNKQDRGRQRVATHTEARIHSDTLSPLCLAPTPSRRATKTHRCRSDPRPRRQRRTRRHRPARQSWRCPASRASRSPRRPRRKTLRALSPHLTCCNNRPEGPAPNRIASRSAPLTDRSQGQLRGQPAPRRPMSTARTRHPPPVWPARGGKTPTHCRTRPPRPPSRTRHQSSRPRRSRERCTSGSPYRECGDDGL